jgi:hypothetical protein
MDEGPESVGLAALTRLPRFARQLRVGAGDYVGVLATQRYGGRTMDGNAITARECLMGTIVNQIRRRGYYLADLDPNPAQRLIDLRWAAQMAGRLIGCRTQTYASALGKRLPMKVTVVVAPVKPGREGFVFEGPVRSIVEDLLQLRVTDHSRRKSA